MPFEKFWFTPSHQPNPEKSVEFELKPLDMRQFHNLSRAMVRADVPTFDLHSEVFVQNVSAWRGIERECSVMARQEICKGAAEFDWLVWLGQVSGELYNRALLTGAERKNF